MEDRDTISMPAKMEFPGMYDVILPDRNISKLFQYEISRVQDDPRRESLTNFDICGLLGIIPEEGLILVGWRYSFEPFEYPRALPNGDIVVHLGAPDICYEEGGRTDPKNFPWYNPSTSEMSAED